MTTPAPPTPTEPDVATFAIPGFDGITFEAARRSEGPDTPHNWVVITATGPDGEPLNFQVGFAGP